MKNAKSDFHMQNWDSACRKYEEVSLKFSNFSVGVQHLAILLLN